MGRVLGGGPPVGAGEDDAGGGPGHPEHVGGADAPGQGDPAPGLRGLQEGSAN